MNPSRMFGSSSPSLASPFFRRLLSARLLLTAAAMSLMAMGCVAQVGTDDAAQSSTSQLVVANPVPDKTDPAPPPGQTDNSHTDPSAPVSDPGDPNGEPRPNPWKIQSTVPGDDNGEPRPNPWNPHCAGNATTTTTTTTK